MSDSGNEPDQPRDERAERRDARRRASRERMQKHGATTGAVYRAAVLKRLRQKAGQRRRR